MILLQAKDYVKLIEPQKWIFFEIFFAGFGGDAGEGTNIREGLTQMEQ